ncbi:MAG: hypothetical protein HXY20_05155 [Acidobacteria bacterium]|nr:hypothetical protein [Acidobacteriota bacterium]
MDHSQRRQPPALRGRSDRSGYLGYSPLRERGHGCPAGQAEVGDRLCVLANVDLNILRFATPAEVKREVRELIRETGQCGGYIVTSGNSLAGYLKPENVLALDRAVRRYGSYPLQA